MDIYKQSLTLHKKLKGKLKIGSKKPIKTKKDLSLLYTPGVAEASRRIAAKKERAYELTAKGNLVAVISDGSAVLGLGNIGGAASMPVMEGKCAILSEFAAVEAIPIVLETQDAGEIIAIVKNISPSFGAINLEDIAAPKCFFVEESLQDIGIPVFHDDQHGTAIVVTAGLLNAVSVVGKKNKPLKIVINGAGAAGQAITRLLLKSKDLKVKDILVLDSEGIVSKGRGRLDDYKIDLAKLTNNENISGGLDAAIKGADVFVGVSKPGILSINNIQSMTQGAIVFAMANPVPEIMPDVARRAGAAVVATGRSDFPNQVNNALAFPGIFRGLLDARAKMVTDTIKLEAAKAIASLVENPTPESIIPSIFNKKLVDVVSKAVKDHLSK